MRSRNVVFPLVEPRALDKNLRIENIYFSLSLSLSLWLNADFRVRGRKEGDPASNKTNLRNPCPRKPYLEAPGRLVKHRVQKGEEDR